MNGLIIGGVKGSRLQAIDLLNLKGLMVLKVVVAFIFKLFRAFNGLLLQNL